MTDNQIINAIKKWNYKDLQLQRKRPQSQKVATTLIEYGNLPYVLEYIKNFDIKNYNRLALVLCKYHKYKDLAFNLHLFKHLKQNVAEKLIDAWYTENVWAYYDESFDKLPKKILSKIFGKVK